MAILSSWQSLTQLRAVDMASKCREWKNEMKRFCPWLASFDISESDAITDTIAAMRDAAEMLDDE